MSSEKIKVVNSGISFTGLLTIVFIVLKLLKVITWSWLWVLSPIWISIALWIGILILIAIIILVVKLFSFFTS